MRNRIPTFQNKCRVCIICEGDEEYDYLATDDTMWVEKINAILEE